jgi:Protein of unknown function (DUF3379)
MNCLESRRLLLAAPRAQSAVHRAHVASCEDCSRLAHRLSDLERDIEGAVLVPVPDALSHRILLARHGRPMWQYAAAAAFAFVSIAAGLLAGGVVETPGSPATVQAVGPTHPAVVAIAEVANDDEKPQLATTTPGEEMIELQQGLKRLGLTIRNGTSAHYIGKCRIEGSSECDHIVLSTAEGYANVMLVPDYPLADRVLVSDRRMVALVTPARNGAYIVVADSAKTAKRMEKVFVKG